MEHKKIKVLQFICPVGFYGAERWVLAIGNNSNLDSVQQDLVVTIEPAQGELEVVKYYRELEGLKCYELNTKSRFDFSAISNLCKVIRDNNIDLIHTHGYKSDIIGIVAAKITGIKSISTPHGFGEIKSRKMKLFIRLGCFAFRFFDRVVPLSPELMKDVVVMGCPKEKLTYIQNGVDLKEVDYVRESVEVANAYQKEIGYIGRLDKGKQVDHLIKAFSELHKIDSAIHLTIVGDGPARAELEELVRVLGCESNVHFLGFRHDRLELLKRFDVFVLASESEGIPRCLMEAMGMGIPIVSYNISGVDQLISHEKTGLLASLNDTDCLTKCIARIINDDALATRIKSEALSFVQKNFSAGRMSEEYLNLYRKILNRA